MLVKANGKYKSKTKSPNSPLLQLYPDDMLGPRTSPQSLQQPLPLSVPFGDACPDGSHTRCGGCSAHRTTSGWVWPHLFQEQIFWIPPPPDFRSCGSTATQRNCPSEFRSPLRWSIISRRAPPGSSLATSATNQAHRRIGPRTDECPPR